MADSKRTKQRLGCAALVLTLLVLGPVSVYSFLLNVTYAPRHGEGWIDDQRLVPDPPPEPPPLTTASNAWDSYEAAATRLVEPASVSGSFAPPLSELSDMDASAQHPALVKDIIDRNSRSLELLHQAREEAYSPPTDPSTAHRSLAARRNLARFTQTAATYYHVLGQDDEALTVCEDELLAATRAVGNGPLIDMLVGAACIGIAENPTARIIAEGDVSSDRLAKHARFLRELRHGFPSFTDTLRWEHRYTADEHYPELRDLNARELSSFLDAMEEMDFFAPPPAPKSSAEEWIGDVRSLLKARSAALRIDESWEWAQDRNARLIEAAEEPLGSAALVELAERTEEDLAARQDPLASVLVISLAGKSVDTYWRSLACISGLETLAGLRLYEMDHGEYPASLEALVPEYLPELPPDPFTGEPFIYENRGSVLKLYSVGPNRQDDGGLRWGVGVEDYDQVTLPLR